MKSSKLPSLRKATVPVWDADDIVMNDERDDFSFVDQNGTGRAFYFSRFLAFYFTYCFEIF